MATATTQLIHTWPAAREACARLRKHKLLALDMEGAPLSTCTSLLQLAVSPQEVYVFDVLTLGQPLFDAEHLLPILSDPTVIKLCYDCRGDGSALYHQHGVRAYGLYDLQIVYASLRALAPSVLEFSSPPQQQQEAFLKGLQCAVAHVIPTDAARAFAQRKREWKLKWRQQQQALQADAGETHFLLKRPLADDALAYASADVEHLFALHSAWYPYFSTGVVCDASDARMCAATSNPCSTGDSDDEQQQQQRIGIMKALIDFPLLTPLTVRPRRLLFRYPQPTTAARQPRALHTSHI
jgi:hypothetical protein